MSMFNCFGRGHAGLFALAGMAALMASHAPPARAELPEPDVRIMSPVSAADPGSTLPAGWQQGPFMQIYVRAYQDSNGDGIGDLRGLIARLEYLKELGVRGLWLMPVTASQDSDHGYAVKNYRAIESDYGTLADFDELLKQAHARGIGVIIDYVMNHSAADHPLFRQASDSPKNPYRDWYVWADPKPEGWQLYGNTPWYDTDHGAYFAGFWSEMPDFNLKNPAVVAWHHDNLRFWLNRGVDGFRFDAVGNLVENGPLAWESQPQSVALMADVARLVAGYQNRHLVCEAPGDPASFGRACGSAFAFGHQNRLISAGMGSPTPLEQVAAYFKKPAAEIKRIATFASNHDSFAGQRLWDRLRGDAASYRLVAATYLLQPGTPFIYYGEEIGAAGGAGLKGDLKLRAPMSWTADGSGTGFSSATPFRALAANVATHNVAAQQADPDSLLAFYKQLISLRNARPSLTRGSYEAVRTDGSTMRFERAVEGERTLVIYNYGANKQRAVIDHLPKGAWLSPLWKAPGQPATKPVRADARGQARIELAPQSFQVFDLAPVK
jgi:alpha-amylase